MAMCVIAVVAVAPCQCFSPGSNQTTSPGRICSTVPPLSLHPSASVGDDQRLTEWMSMPRGTSAGLERHNPASDPRRCISLEPRIDSHRSGKPIRRSLCGGLRSYPCDFHCVLPLIDLCLAGHCGASSPNQYEAVTPPSMRISLPVMKPPSGPIRSAPTFATSSGVPARPAGQSSIMRR